MSSRSGEKAGHPRRGIGGSKRSHTLARHLTAWQTLPTLLLVFLASVALLHRAHTRAANLLADHVLRERIQAVRALLGDGQKRRELQWTVESGSNPMGSPLILLRVLGCGESSMETTGMGRQLPAQVFPAPAGLEIPVRGISHESGLEQSFRIMAASATSAMGGDCVIHAAFHLTSAGAALQTESIQITVAMAGLALAALSLAYLVTRRGIRPLEEVAEAAGRIGPSTLSERIHAVGWSAKISEVGYEFNAMLDRLEEGHKRLSDFSANLAHELRTSLNNLWGEAEEALSKDRSPEEYRRVLAYGLRKCADLARIIDGLLFVARAERPGMPMERERVDLNTELREIVDYHEPAANEKGLSLRIQNEAELRADLDRVLFRRALSNLLTNAIAYTPVGGEIRVAAALRGDALEVTVADTGVGIAAEHLPHVFDRYYRAGPESARKPGGVGLGLSIVKAVMDLHHGSAEIQSELGKGTRVVLTFPNITKS